MRAMEPTTQARTTKAPTTADPNARMARTDRAAERDDRAERAERASQRRAVPPAVDIFENEDEILLRADVPGVSIDGVTVDLHKDRLTLTARRNDASPDGPDFHRVFQVPRGIDAENIRANLSQGVLQVTLPKSAALKPRRVPIEAG